MPDTTPDTQADYSFETAPPFVMIRARTDAAKDHAATAFAGATTWAGAIVCEPRLAPGIAEDLYFNEGFAVMIDGKLADAERD